MSNIITTSDFSNKPQHVIAEAKEAAVQLTKLIKQNKWVTNIRGREHLHFEAWQTLARFYNLTVRTASTTYIEYGGQKGFEARAEVVNSAGAVVGAGESMCLLGESNQWTNKPLYAVRAMAQTRAGARALRQLLSWIVVLAGYDQLPAEEAESQYSDVDGRPREIMCKSINTLVKTNKITLPDGKYIRWDEQTNSWDTNLTYDQAREILVNYKMSISNGR